jgi:hypothetical protein
MVRSPLVLLLLAAGCDAPSHSPASTPVERTESAPAGLVPPLALAAALPDRIGPFDARAPAESATDPRDGAPITRAQRAYTDGQRTAVLRVIDATRAPELAIGFAAAQHLETEMGERELVATGIADRPALASWDRATSTSEAQVLARSRLVIALHVTPARESDEAVALLDTIAIPELEALLR